MNLERSPALASSEQPLDILDNSPTDEAQYLMRIQQRAKWGVIGGQRGTGRLAYYTTVASVRASNDNGFLY